MAFELKDPSSVGCELEVSASSSTAPQVDVVSEEDVWCPFRTVTRFPKVTLVVLCVLQLLVWLVTVCLIVTGHNVVPLDLNALPIQILDGEWYARSVGSTLARWGHGLNIANEYWKEPDRTSYINKIRIDLLYGSSDNILTAEKMAAIKAFEKNLSKIEDLNYFFDFYSLFKFVPAEVIFDNRVAALLIKEAKKNETLSKSLYFLLPKNYTLNEEFNFATTPMLRSVLIPKSYISYVSEEADTFRDGPLKSFLEKHGEKATIGSDVSFAYWSFDLFLNKVTDQGLKDTVFAIGSLLFILLIILLHTGSLALMSAALLSISTALASANLIYRYAFGRQYIGVFHTGCVFLLLGIGADDVFVLFDAWRDSFRVQLASDAHRLRWVLRRAGGAALITSLTSALAFLVNAACAVPLVHAVGLFTGLAVLVNYLILVTFLPVVLLNMQVACGDSSVSCCRPNWKEDGPRRMAKFFENIVLPFLRMRAVPFVCLAVGGILACVFIWQATLLRPPSSMLIQMFHPGSNFDRAEKMLSYMTSYRPAEVIVGFGYTRTDRSRCPTDDFDCQGNTTFLGDFDLNVPGAQEAMLRFCRRLRTTRAWRKRLHLLADPRDPKDNYVRCFVDDMERDMALPAFRRCPSDPSGPPLNLTIPIGRKKIERLTQCYPHLLANKNKTISQGFSRFYEAALSFWLTTSIKSNRSDYAYTNVIMTWKGGDPDLGSHSGRMRIAVVSAFTDLSSSSGSFFVGKKIRDSWESIVGREISQMPTAALRAGFQCTQASSDTSPLDFWQWYNIQEALWNNARAGILSGLLGVALPVLFLATRNVVLALAGVACLGFATGGVISMANAFSWTLGLSESINLAIVTGLAVDCVVHFIEAYHQASAGNERRGERVRQMLVRVGGAVSSGVLTTIGAIMFLFASKLRSFVQFGAFLGFTIFFSFFAALFLLTPFLLLLGPERSFASLDPCLRLLWDKRKKRSSP